MSQFFNMIVSQSLLDEQSSLIGGMVGTLRSGLPFTIDPTDKTAIAALAGLENLLDEIAVQLDGQANPEPPVNPFNLSRSALIDHYLDFTGESLDDVFGCSDWDTFDGREFVCDALGS